MKIRSVLRVTASAAALALLLSGCVAAPGGDKAGGDTLVMHLATVDSVNPNGQYVGQQVFLDSLITLSGGRVKIDLTNRYGNGAADAESTLVKAIASGEVDGGWPATRAFGRAGISGLEVTEAPMTITSIAAEKALVSGPIAPRLLDRLRGTGVVGLGLTVGPLRRPFAAQAPLLGPEDWQKARFRVYNSRVQSDTVEALGGDPANLGVSWIDEVRAGTLRGGEFDIAQYSANSFGTETPFVSANVVLWPTIPVLSLSQKRFDALSAQQRGWVLAAADRAVRASVDADYDESTSAREYCTRGVRFVDASADQITELRERVAPVVERLAVDAAATSVLTDIRAVAAEHPGVDAPEVPASCRDAATAAITATVGAVPNQVASVPDGLYRVSISLHDVEAAGFSNEQGWTGTWTLEIERGTYQLRCRPLDMPGKDCGNVNFNQDNPFDTVLEAGLVRGTGDTVYFVYDATVHSKYTGCALPCFPIPTSSFTWTLVGDTLTMHRMGGTGSVERVIKPWRKVS
jgi:TRAP-type C4-dicarboxylate transport system substrate-binding protein